MYFARQLNHAEVDAFFEFRDRRAVMLACVFHHARNLAQGKLRGSRITGPRGARPTDESPDESQSHAQNIRWQPRIQLSRGKKLAPEMQRFFPDLDWQPNLGGDQRPRVKNGGPHHSL